MTNRRLKPIARIIEQRRSVVERCTPLPLVITVDDDGRAVAEYSREEAERGERRFSSLHELLAYHSLSHDEVEELRPIVVYPLRVLVLDDPHPVGQCALDEQITHAGFHTQLVHTCEEALKAMERVAPAVAIVDVATRNGEGKKLLQTFARMPESPPVVIVSSHGSASQIAHEHGLEQIDKPCDPRHLLRAMERAIRDGKRPKMS